LSEPVVTTAQANPRFEGGSWFSVVDPEAEAGLRDLLGHVVIQGCLPMVAAFCYWNGSPLGFPPAHLVLQQFASLARGGGSARATVPAVDRALRTFLKAYSFGNEGVEQDSEFHRRPIDERLPEGDMMRAAARVITNPGSPGQMLQYALRKFEPLSPDLNQALGFGIREACVSVRIVQETFIVGTHPYFVRGLPPFDRRAGPRRNLRIVETPSAAFLRDWAAASSYPNTGSVASDGSSVSSPVIRFLSCQAADFALPGPSFGRWAFVQEAQGKSVLLVPSMLGETLLSAVHMALFERLAPERSGAVGVLVGERFEALVGDQFRRRFPEESVHQQVRRTPNAPEADFVVDLFSGEQIVVQCKGRVLRQRGRWGDPDLFFGDIEANIVDAADQARRYLADNSGGSGVRSVFIVLDAYLPLTPFYTGAQGRIGAAVRDLPLPCVLSYYDLEYMLGKFDEPALLDYLRWRGALLESRALLVHDEFDAVRAYLRLHRAMPADRMIERNLSVLYVGYDPQFETEVLRAVDEELGLHFDHPPHVEEIQGRLGAGPSTQRSGAGRAHLNAADR
jgi:hypothetical protein